jgi:hypothetical protein
MPNTDHICGSLPPENSQKAFGSLVAHLGAMRADGYRFRMWWRDDDGYCDTTELRRLLIARRNAPIALAVIPGLLDATLVNLVDGIDGVSVFQHGWKHINWSGEESRPSEFPEFRPPSEASVELRDGLKLLEVSFGRRFHPVLVPPWHSCPRWLLDDAARLGYLAVSRETPLFPLLSRGSGQELNVEIDTSDWTARGAFIGALELTRRIVRAFEIRIKWSAESAPIGLLTHHAFLTSSDCDCLSLFVRLLEEFDAVEWVAVKSLINSSL